MNAAIALEDVRQVRISEAVAAVPGPIVGAGLPGLIAACGALIILARRRRSARL